MRFSLHGMRLTPSRVWPLLRPVELATFGSIFGTPRFRRRRGDGLRGILPYVLDLETGVRPERFRVDTETNLGFGHDHGFAGHARRTYDGPGASTVNERLGPAKHFPADPPTFRHQKRKSAKRAGVKRNSGRKPARPFRS